MSRFFLIALAAILIAAPTTQARTIDNTGIADSDIVSGMWDEICTTLPFCDVGEEGVDLIARRVIKIALDTITALTVIVLMYAGIKMTASRGNEEGFTQAKKVATYAAIGLLLAVISENLVLYIADVLLPRLLGG